MGARAAKIFSSSEPSYASSPSRQTGITRESYASFKQRVAPMQSDALAYGRYRNSPCSSTDTTFPSNGEGFLSSQCMSGRVASSQDLAAFSHTDLAVVSTLEHTAHRLESLHNRLQRISSLSPRRK